MSLVAQIADSLDMYVDEVEEFARARYGAAPWTDDLAAAVKADLNGPGCVRSVPQMWWSGIDPTNGTGATKMR